MTLSTIEFIKEKGLQALKDELGISVKYNDDNTLMLLDYNQIESPKFHPVVMECRGLILEVDTLMVVARSFDRFFNYGEVNTHNGVEDQTQKDFLQSFPIEKLYFREKIDGSLIRIYFYGGHWRIATRGTIDAFKTQVGDHGISFGRLVWKALGVSNQEDFDDIFGNVDVKFTIICEVTSIENQVVKRYEGYNLYLLGVRNTVNGSYANLNNFNYLPLKSPKLYNFSSFEEAHKVLDEIEDLDEGYVLYEKTTNKPAFKMKSPCYVAAHYLRNNNQLSKKYIIQMIITGEMDEYLTYFPQDEFLFKPYMDAYDHFNEFTSSMYRVFNVGDDRKEYAEKVMRSTPVMQKVMFKLWEVQPSHPDVFIHEYFKGLPERGARDLLLKFMALYPDRYDPALCVQEVDETTI